METLLQAKEAGLGYPIDDEETNVLYIAPNPVVKISNNNFHSETGPAISFYSRNFYYLNGVGFPQELWEEVVSGKMSFADRLKIEDVDQRTQAINPKFCDIDAFLKESQAVLLDERAKLDINGEPVSYQLYKIPKGDIFTEDAYYCYFSCPSTGHKHFEGVEVSQTVAEAMAWAMSNPELGIVVTPEQWELMVPLVDEN